MKTNLGPADRMARIVVGVSALTLVLIGPQTLWGLLGIVPLVTGLYGTCPLYMAFGFSSCPRKDLSANSKNVS